MAEAVGPGSASRNDDPRLPIDRVIAGGAAGALSRVTTAPIDRVKLLIQVNAGGSYVPPFGGGGVPGPPATTTPPNAWSVGSRIVKREGVGALWRGTGAAVVRILPYSATTFTVFPWYNEFALRAFGVFGENESSDGTLAGSPGKQIAARFTAGALAGTTATVLTYPLDLLHARVSAHVPGEGKGTASHPGGVGDSSKNFRNGDGFAKHTKTNGGVAYHLRSALKTGGVRSLYSGLGPTLVGIVPYGGVSFATFESIKALYNVRHGAGHGEDTASPENENSTENSTENEMPTLHKLCAGAVAGFLAQTVTYPLHVVRRRMQVHGGGSLNGTGGVKGLKYTGMLHGLFSIYKTEGVKNGLFKGVGLTWIKGPIAAAVGFTANDHFQQKTPAARRLVFGGGNPEVNPNCKEKNPSPNPKEVHKPPATYIEAKQSTAVEALVAGGIAGAVAKSAIAPADRVKIIFQVDKSRQFSVSNALTVAKNIVKTEGVFGLWRGNGVMMVRVVPYAGVSFFSYPRFEKAATEAFGVLFGAPDGTSGQLVGNNGDTGSGSTSSTSSITSTAPTHSGVATRFIAGSAAGATATAITYPLDLMRARYAAAGSVGMSKQSLGNGLHLANTSKGLGSLLGDMTRVVQKEGVRGLYGGITPTLLGIVPYAGISFATFETLKTRYKESHKDGDGNRQNCEPPAATRLLFGGLAGLFAQSVTYPLDIVRRRIQVVGASGGYVSPWQTLVTIANTEGFRRGLYKGVSMNWIKGPISVGVSFFVNDQVKAYLKEHREDESWG